MVAGLFLAVAGWGWQMGARTAALSSGMLAMLNAVVALVSWERRGFRQLLDAKDAEIERLRRLVNQPEPPTSLDRDGMQ